MDTTEKSQPTDGDNPSPEEIKRQIQRMRETIAHLLSLVTGAEVDRRRLSDRVSALEGQLVAADPTSNTELMAKIEDIVAAKVTSGSTTFIIPYIH